MNLGTKIAVDCGIFINTTSPPLRGGEGEGFSRWYLIWIEGAETPPWCWLQRLCRRDADGTLTVAKLFLGRQASCVLVGARRWGV
jgi:hypothetical protein